MFCNNTKRYYESMPRGFCETTKNFFPKIRKCVLPKSWELFFKYIKKCLAELLRAVLDSDKNEQLRELAYFLLEHGRLF